MARWAIAVVLTACLGDALPPTAAQAVPHATVTQQPCPKARPLQVARIPAGEAMLTFDDGPDPRWTPVLLGVLARYKVKATFFLVGKNAARYPALVRQIVADGNVIGNHSWDHADLDRLGPSELAREIDRTDATLKNVTGAEPCFFRFPYGAADRATIAAVNARGLTPFYWSVDTRDWAGVPTSEIVATVWRELSTRHGAIVLQHDIQGPRSIDAVPTIIAGLRARHYRFVTAALGRPTP